MKTKLLAVILTGLGLLSSVEAQSCRSFSYCPPVYQQPTVVREVIVEKKVEVIDPFIVRFAAVIPLTTFGTYSAVQTTPVVVAPPAVVGGGIGVGGGGVGVNGGGINPVVNPPAVGGSGGISSSDMNRIMGGFESINRNMKSFNDRLSAVEAKVFGNGTSPNPPDTTVKPPAIMDKADDKEVKNGKIDPKTMTALSIVQGKCASCHDAKVSKEKGDGFTLLDGNTLAKMDDKVIKNVIRTIYSGKMPPPKTGVKLTDEEVSVLIESLTK